MSTIPTASDAQGMPTEAYRQYTHNGIFKFERHDYVRYVRRWKLFPLLSPPVVISLRENAEALPSSSQLFSQVDDLSSLYGVTKEQREAVRTRDGFGTIVSSALEASDQMNNDVVKLLQIFCRGHNDIAVKHLKANAKGTYIKTIFPDVVHDAGTTAGTEDLKSIQDDEIFAVAKKINDERFSFLKEKFTEPPLPFCWELDLDAEQAEFERQQAAGELDEYDNTSDGD
ncbi:hypothetical protein P7C70_g4373, partial [Phenoliferia sp. Uapishka_3]